MVLQKKIQRKNFGITKPLVLVFGGSQGAKKLNETMIQVINNKKIEDFEIIYATGPKQYDEIMSKVKANNPNVKIEKYIYNMEEIMVASDLAVCRSGALTVTELGIVGLPAILVPFPYAAENHQYFNAKTIEDVGAGVIIEEKDLDAEKLYNNIVEIISDNEKLKVMADKAKKVEMNNAIEKIMYELNLVKKEKGLSN